LTRIGAIVIVLPVLLKTIFRRLTVRVTTKGQVTIPQPIREKFRIVPSSEVDFVEEDGKVYIVKKKESTPERSAFRKLRGIASVKMSTEEIMSLTRG
jgi:AbrB family looped-hinge helix DNA binding protein